MVAAATVALFRAVTCSASDMTLQEHEEIASIAAKHLGEGTGIARLCAEVKARGQPLLAKQLSQQHRARNQHAHPRTSALSLADRLDKVLEVPGPVPPPREASSEPETEATTSTEAFPAVNTPIEALSFDMQVLEGKAKLLEAKIDGLLQKDFPVVTAVVTTRADEDLTAAAPATAGTTAVATTASAAATTASPSSSPTTAGTADAATTAPSSTAGTTAAATTASPTTAGTTAAATMASQTAAGTAAVATMASPATAGTADTATTASPTTAGTTTAGVRSIGVQATPIKRASRACQTGPPQRGNDHPGSGVAGATANMLPEKITNKEPDSFLPAEPGQRRAAAEDFVIDDTFGIGTARAPTAGADTTGPTRRLPSRHRAPGKRTYQT